MLTACSYPEVRASVPPSDNISLSINSKLGIVIYASIDSSTAPRMWVLTILFALVGSASNLFFSLRYPSVSINPIIALILVHPLGRTWDWFLQCSDDVPHEFVNGWSLPYAQANGLPILQRLRLWLAQGKWNEKEHACVYVGSNVAFGFAFATDVQFSLLIYPSLIFRRSLSSRRNSTNKT
jgi:hypothetical protein